jgi:thiamine biosynthesis lipoprotein ApbE
MLLNGLIFNFAVLKTNPMINSIGLSLLALTPAASSATGLLTSHFENVLGTSLDLKIVASSEVAATAAETKVLAEINRLNDILSAHGSSEFILWRSTRGESVEISSELREVLKHFEEWNVKTDGALNAASEHISQLWTSEIPSMEARENAVLEVNQPHWSLNENGATRLTDTELKLHSFTKSYVMEKAATEAMTEEGVAGVVVNIGGDFVVKGDWTEKIGVSDPRNSAENAEALAYLQVNNKAVATSGDYRRGTQIDGVHYSHIMDPRTAEPASEVISATVAHQDAVTAGALATAFNVLGVAASIDLATQYPEASFLIVDKEGSEFRSENLPSTSTEKSAISLVNVKEKLWTAGQTLDIKFELARFEGRARRPFVAVWIEDENHKPVRRIAVWYNKPRWLPDLRSWFAAKREVEFDVASVTGATRGAGEYTLVWDGKNDKGEYVPLGKYTVFIEAAREHGTYQLIKQEMKFDGKAKNQALPGGEEMSSASLSYKTK